MSEVKFLDIDNAPGNVNHAGSIPFRVNMDDMKVGIIIPDRGDRPQFTKNCLRQVAVQTLQPSMVKFIDFAPDSDLPDITRRYRIGYNTLSNYNIDVICFMENDDWYAPNYLEYMCEIWNMHGRPDLMGPSNTMYYHLKLKKYMMMLHENRASAMNTMIKPGMEFNWPLDHDPYTDQWLWTQQNGIKTKKIVRTPALVTIGMKHGIGMCGGEMHKTYLERYIHDDAESLMLKQHLDDDSYRFFTTVAV